MSTENDIKAAELARAMKLVGDVWEKSVVVTPETMCEHFEALSDMIDEKLDFAEFVAETGLQNQEVLN